MDFKIHFISMELKINPGSTITLLGRVSIRLQVTVLLQITNCLYIFDEQEPVRRLSAVGELPGTRLVTYIVIITA